MNAGLRFFYAARKFLGLTEDMATPAEVSDLQAQFNVWLGELRSSITDVIPKVSAIEIAKLDLQPGDRLVLCAPSKFSAEQANWLKNQLLTWGLPEGVKPLVLTEGIQIQVLTSQALKALIADQDAAA